MLESYHNTRTGGEGFADMAEFFFFFFFFFFWAPLAQPPVKAYFYLPVITAADNNL